MSKPVFSDCLAFAGRRNRKSYLLLMACLFGLSLLVGIVAEVVVVVATLDRDPLQSELMVRIAPQLACLPLGFLATVATAQRCRDLGWSGWWALAASIPIVGWIFILVLLVMKGEVGTNAYGPDPLGSAEGPNRARQALGAA